MTWPCPSPMLINWGIRRLDRPEVCMVLYDQFPPSSCSSNHAGPNTRFANATVIRRNLLLAPRSTKVNHQISVLLTPRGIRRDSCDVVVIHVVGKIPVCPATSTPTGPRASRAASVRRHAEPSSMFPADDAVGPPIACPYSPSTTVCSKLVPVIPLTGALKSVPLCMLTSVISMTSAADPSRPPSPSTPLAKADACVTWG